MFDWRAIPSGRHVLLWLTLALVPAFAVTALVSGAHHAGQQAIAAEWRGRGEAALAAGNAADAVEAFRTALTFQRQDRLLRLRLAEALAAAGRGSEARAHLLMLWEDQPGNARVNLDLARLAASAHDVTAALRYYHNAIEGAWPANAERERRATRIELVRFLIAEHAIPQAQAELITLSGNLPADIDGQKRVATLMLEGDLPARALPIYEAVMRQGPDAGASAGAARAAFAMGNDALATRYAEIAVRQGDRTDDTAGLLELLRLENAIDPFARRLSSRARAARARAALEAAGRRLACLADSQDPPAAELRAELSAMLSPRTLHADMLDEAMDLVGRIEHATAGSCGAPAPIDVALRRIAERRQGAGQ